MNMQKRRRVKGEREIFSYMDLYHAAVLSAGRILEHRLDCMTIILYCAFLLEAYMNHIGNRSFQKQEWEGRGGVERYGPKEKLYAIAKKINYDFDPGRAPFQSFFLIFRFRDALVHGKTVVDSFDDEQIIDSGRLPKYPKTDWERNLETPATAQRFFEHTEAIMEELHTASGLDQEHDLFAYSSRWKWESWVIEEGAEPPEKRPVGSEEDI